MERRKWSCQPDRQEKDTTLPNHPDLLTEIQCAEGKILRWSAQGWGCSDDRDPDKIANTDYLAGLSCSNSNSVRWNSATQSWICSNVEDTKIDTGTSCKEHETLVLVAGKWSCRTPAFRHDAVLRTAAGGKTTCAIFADGSTRCWGSNDQGQLGQGNTNNLGDTTEEMGASLPEINLPGKLDARSLDAGEKHVCALLRDAYLKCWGDNEFGQLGIGNSDDMGDAAGETEDENTKVFSEREKR